jgi:hypothetical protein
MNAKRSQSTLPWSVVLSLALLAAACTNTHEAPQGGTETGNPPVIDASLIALVVSQDEVHVRGERGAATPGATIEIISTLTHAVFNGRAASDGSFDIQVDAPKTDSFEVRALSDGGSSDTVHVVRGGASVGEGRQDELSCRQREQLASAQMTATSEGADTRCARDEDCVLAPLNTLCNDSCFDVPVSTAGARELEEARSAIENGLCDDFAVDACTFLALPCVPPTSTSVGCRDQRCQLIQPAEQPSADCSSSFDPGTGTLNMPVYWYYPQAGVCLLSVYGGVGGNGNRYDTLEVCETACSRSGACPPNRIEANVCVEPGLAGGCGRMASACALACSETVQCASEAFGDACIDNMCQAVAPF